MKTIRIGRLFVAAATLVIMLIIGCKKYNNSTNNYDNGTPAMSNSIQLMANTKFGNIMTDGSGRTLYFFSIDAGTTSNCTGGCLAVWPVFYSANPTLGTGLNASDFATITRSDGAMQTTYKGWPLYYYSGDIYAGDTNGDPVDNTWFVAKADYSVMISDAQLVGLDGKQYTSAGVAGTAISQYLVDDRGHTLYMFTPDKANTNTFTKADFSNNITWSIDSVKTVQSVPSILLKSDFAIINVFGHSQISFRGRPLYFFGQDAATRGNTKGVSFPTPGAAIWKVTNSSTVVLN
ncbi:putative lipoprotein with Yx(FWY)xxD motif [Mucilaginibacter yixingensis]|uniref:Putative lipoprotein with Yx(FWY)xxD motif n=1 Tax=Mucilaginibacter yixingensis TaxID=1295612 RepID=A0A2T5J7N9_9SPHI|nr:hypothetical protein [Mucilaginibacter yixingensis]PTQ95165.1 putative lipoprotein with Yx(FWY)xxD motif [Mucilaginibacter yixingensis]